MSLNQPQADRAHRSSEARHNGGLTLHSVSCWPRKHHQVWHRHTRNCQWDAEAAVTLPAASRLEAVLSGIRVSPESEFATSEAFFDHLQAIAGLDREPFQILVGHDTQTSHGHQAVATQHCGNNPPVNFTRFSGGRALDIVLQQHDP
jgi:hypothetical protein